MNKILIDINIEANGTIISSLAHLIGIRLGGISGKRFHIYSLLFLFVSFFITYLYIKNI